MKTWSPLAGIKIRTYPPSGCFFFFSDLALWSPLLQIQIHTFYFRPGSVWRKRCDNSATRDSVQAEIKSFASDKQATVVTAHWRRAASTGAAVRRRGLLPGFFGVRVKVPLTVRQWELSPPQTPHLSSTLLEPISLSQPTFWCHRRKDTGENVCVCGISLFLNGSSCWKWLSSREVTCEQVLCCPRHSYCALDVPDEGETWDEKSPASHSLREEQCKETILSLTD